MKHLIGTLSVVFLLSFSISAQDVADEWSFIDEESAPAEENSVSNDQIANKAGFAFLQLTPEQKPRVSAITKRFLKETKSKRAELRKKRKEANALRKVKGRKDKVFREKRKEVKKLTNDLNQMFRNNERQIFEVLTPEQKRLWNAKKKRALEKKKTEGRKKMKGMHERRGKKGARLIEVENGND